MLGCSRESTEAGAAGRVSLLGGQASEVRGQQGQTVILKVWLLRGDVKPRDGFEQRSKML